MSEWKMTDDETQRVINDVIAHNGYPEDTSFSWNHVVEAAVRLKIVMPVPTEADVERVARAIAASDDDGDKHSNLFGASPAEYMALARAALAALGDMKRDYYPFQEIANGL